jgi:hypothetical protein
MYIGQSVYIENRYSRHLSQLKKETHINLHLLRAYKLYGKDKFELIVLEKCTKSDLPIKEQKWINKFQRDKLYNLVFNIQFMQGENNPFYGKHHSDETKMKLSSNRIGKYTGKNGNKVSLETKIKMVRNNSTTKLTVENALEIKNLLLNGKSHQEIANLFNISRSVITRISNGKRWSNITGGPVVPIIYDQTGKRVLNQSHKAKIGKSRSGKLHSAESKEKMRKKRLGKKHSEETRAKMSESHKNKE